ncbi:aldolase/citrate lyase family protein [Croceiramulus getboli]|nr:aldolase/citrate lyase family protein [Flavobacteriaceae bacterium YJPT1-3]
MLFKATRIQCIWRDATYKLYAAFLENDFKKFVVPKIQNKADLDKMVSFLSGYDAQIILLVETPRLYLELLTAITDYKNAIFGLALGSHDYMAAIGGAHTLKNLEVVRQNMLSMARAINGIAVDIASMDLGNLEDFEVELQDGFNKGFDAKFLIHPKQYEFFKAYTFYSEDEYTHALKIVALLEDVKSDTKEFNPVVVDGQIIERPHLDRALKIVNTYRN